ncbi:MAG TPA: kelch repeat-containing protein [Candidatus Dormibacteraeota bacterium]
MRRVLIASCLLILVPVAGVVAVRVPTADAGTSGVWSAAANLITGREEHTATLLQNGTVLVAGGTDGRGTALAKAELYDPKTNRWVSAGTMTTTRLDHTATLLRNGKVLVVGGLDTSIPSNTLASSEFYDPNTNRWSPAASMRASRARQSATALLDGRVLVVGGQTFTVRDAGLFTNQLLGAEVYDPVTNAWSSTAPMLQNRVGQSATLLQDGRVLVAGGGDGQTSSSSAEIYDPKQDRWSAAAPMTTDRQGHTATLLRSGDVLVTGGVNRQAQSPVTIAPFSSAEVYDPRINRWSAVARMAEARDEYTATLLGDGRVLIVGGTGQSRAEVYDPNRNVWSTTGGTMNRYLHTAMRLPDGRVLVAGGYGVESLDSALLYDPSATAPVRRAPANALVVGGLLLAGFVLLAAVALLIPDVRRRLRRLRSPGGSEEWIN